MNRITTPKTVLAQLHHTVKRETIKRSKSLPAVLNTNNMNCYQLKLVAFIDIVVDKTVSK